MKKPLKIVLIILGVILLVLINVCVGAILINKDKTKKMLDDYSSIYTNDKYQDVVSVDNLNYIKQDVSCGYAVIEMFAKWRGNEEITEKYLYDKYGKVVTSTGKSFEEEMNKQFPEFKTTMDKNLKSSELIDKVYDSLLKGVPVPFECAAKYEDKWTLHYSIVTAMDIPNDKITIMNPYGYEENISIKEFIDRTSFEAYDHMPIIFKLGFAFNIFEKNTIFIVEMPQVLDGAPGMDETPSVGSGNDYYSISDKQIYSSNWYIRLNDYATANGGRISNPYYFTYASFDTEVKSVANHQGLDVIAIFELKTREQRYASMVVTFGVGKSIDADKMDIYEYKNGKLHKLDKITSSGSSMKVDVGDGGIFTFVLNE